MKGRLFILLLFLVLLSLPSKGQQKVKVNKNTAFSLGEKIKYRLKYSFFTAGYGELTISPKLNYVNGKECYKIKIEGYTASFFDHILRVRDSWESYIDVSTLMPIQFRRKVEEGSYRKTEITNFNHDEKSARVSWKKKAPEWKSKSYEIKDPTYDIVSLYSVMRNFDYSNAKRGDKFLVNAFFEDELYELEVHYLGKEVLKTDFGKFNTFKLAPVLPHNSVFEDEDAVVFWATDDRNKLLLEAKVKIKVIPGSNAKLKVEEFEGLRYPLTSKIKD